jgi:uncharacterized damage-inducible protein DinB
VNTSDYISQLYESQFWGMNRILSLAAGLSEQEYASDTGFTSGSVRAILTHALAAESMYISRSRGLPTPTPDSPDWISEESLPTIEALTERWAAEEKVTRAFLENLTEDQLAAEKTFKRRDGVEVTQVVWHMLTTVHQHSLQHRAEAAEALTKMGRSPGNLDFIVYINER